MLYKNTVGKITMFVDAYYLPLIDYDMTLREVADDLPNYIPDSMFDRVFAAETRTGRVVYVIKDSADPDDDMVAISDGSIYVAYAGREMLVPDAEWFDAQYTPLKGE